MANFSKPKWEVQDFVLKADRELPEDQQTKWKIKPLCQSDSVIVADAIVSKKYVEASVYAARQGIVGWENLTMDGDPFLFRGRISPVHKDKLPRCTQEEFEQLPAEWLAEIGGEIIELSQLSETEKN